MAPSPRPRWPGSTACSAASSIRRRLHPAESVADDGTRLVFDDPRVSREVEARQRPFLVHVLHGHVRRAAPLHLDRGLEPGDGRGVAGRRRPQAVPGRQGTDVGRRRSRRGEDALDSTAGRERRSLRGASPCADDGVADGAGGGALMRHLRTRAHGYASRPSPTGCDDGRFAGATAPCPQYIPPPRGASSGDPEGGLRRHVWTRRYPGGPGPDGLVPAARGRALFVTASAGRSVVPTQVPEHRARVRRSRGRAMPPRASPCSRRSSTCRRHGAPRRGAPRS